MTRAMTSAWRSAFRGASPRATRSAPDGGPGRRLRPTPREALALSGWLALAATALPAGLPAGPLRAVVTGVFLLTCPGIAVLLRARPTPAPFTVWPGRLATAVLVVTLSVALSALVAEALFLPGLFTVRRAVAALALLTTVLTLLPSRRPPAPDRSTPAVPAPQDRPEGPEQPDGPGEDAPEPAARQPGHRPGGPPARHGRLRTGYLAGVLLLLLTVSCAPAIGTTGGTASPPSAAPNAGAPAAGQPAAAGPWHPVLRDDFNGTALNPLNWTTCYDWALGGCTNAGNGEDQWYLSSQVAVSGGALTLTADRRTTYGSDGKVYPWTSGMVSTGRDSWTSEPRRTFTYGYFAAAIQLPQDAAGFFPAFWLIPAETRGTPPELDVAEFANSDQRVDMNLHWRTADGNDAHVGRRYGPVDLSSGYHVFAMDWEPTSVTWYVDGVQRFSVTDPAQLPHVPMEVVLNLAVGYLQSPPSTVSSAQLRVDWVGVWQH
ncbi:family 16 glycosylhydrolase [Kitasatospora sp. NPDC050543]|uniref:glycoside hydrolase family 16 protein n=1 Tax=Kitasatospora sp. NPDC050543 TaxID=3364054 RepID=UPI0037A60BC8